MQIQWIRYKGSNTRYLLALILGTRNHKVCILECSKVPDNEVKLLRKMLPALTSVSLGELIGWLKAYCPTSYRLAYKELLASKLEVLRQYSPGVLPR